MKHDLLSLAFVFLVTGMGTAWGQCEADATVYLTDYAFTPSNLTIEVGQTVAFVNAEGTHNVDGTAANNPVPFFLEETEGNIDGVCMGTVTFDVPGVYSFNSSVGLQPELGMTGTITVDAETLCDKLINLSGAYDADRSSWAFRSYFGCVWFGMFPSEGFPNTNVNLNGLDQYTLFLPENAAIEELQELLNLGQFDLLYFNGGMVEGLSYHMVPGKHLAEDLQDGAMLPTVEGQDIAVSVDGEGTVMLNEATILHEDIEAFNGVIHIIDEVLVPPGYPAATTWDIIEQSPDHTYFEQALLAEGFKDDLRGQPYYNDNGPPAAAFTVFAPTDDAFIAFAEANGFASVDELLDSQFIDDIVQAHLVVSVVPSDELTDGSVLSTYSGDLIDIEVDGETITANTAPIVDPDVLAYNGVVHVLGDLMPFEFPAVEGTCGAWTIVMTCAPSDFGAGWQGSSLHVYADGEEIAVESMASNGTESFSVPVDAGSRMDVVYADGGNGIWHGYSILDNNGQELFTTSGLEVNMAENQPPKSVYRLEPCNEMSSCGLMEVTFFDGEGYGWFAGGMQFYSDEGLESQIVFNPDFDGDGDFDYIEFGTRTVMVNAWEGDVDFVVTLPVAYANQCGYEVRNPDGDLVVEDNVPGQDPGNALNVTVCDPGISATANLEVQRDLHVHPNPATTFCQLQGLNGQEPWEAQVFGLDGKRILEQTGIGTEPLSIEGLTPGLYHLIVQFGEGETRSFRLMKE